MGEYLKGDEKMGQEIIRVKNEKELETQTENAIMEGFKIENKTNKMVTLVKAGNFGNPIIHLLVFVLTGWWSLLITNIIYAVYCYTKTQNRLIKVE